MCFALASRTDNVSNRQWAACELEIGFLDFIAVNDLVQRQGLRISCRIYGIDIVGTRSR